MKTHEEYKKAVDTLDLGPIMAKLEYEGMEKATIERLEVMYRRFLMLNALHPEEVMVPTKELDEFWHHHILDTAKYAADCDSVFGFFLHHFPYFGMRDEADAEELQRCFANTGKYYLEHFGEPYMLPTATGAMCNGGVCGEIDSWRPSYTYA